MERNANLPVEQTHAGPAAERVAASPAAPAHIDPRTGVALSRGYADTIFSSPPMALQRKLIEGIQNSPRMVAQRRQINSTFGGTAQLAGGPEAEELLQGQLMQGKFALVQRAEAGADRESGEKQKQGGALPPRHLQAKVSINDDASLEQEADAMGAKAAQMQTADAASEKSQQHRTHVPYRQSAPPIQMVREGDFVADPEDFMRKNVILFEYGKGFSLRYPQTVTAIGSRIPGNNLISNVKRLMARNKDVMSFYLQDAGTKAKDDKPVYFTTPALGLLPDTEIKTIFMNGDTPLDDAGDLVATLKDEDGGGENIRANYAPYFIGDPNLKTDGSGAKDADTWDNVGHTIVDPRVTKFVFTDAMNGCAYAITKVEGDDVKFEAWHFQSETDNFNQASHFRATKAIRDWFGVNDYYIGDGSTNLAATNIIWNSDDGTKMLSQKNIVPLNGGDSTTFLESTSHDLNVSEDMQKEHLQEIHTKLKRGIGNAVKQADVDVLNQKIQALTVGIALAHNSMNKIRIGETAMSQNEATEIKRLPDNIATNKVHASVYPVDLAMFDGLAGLKQALDEISSPGRFYGTHYDTKKTIPLKGRFLQASTDLFSTVSGLVDEATRIIVTTSADELNPDLTERCFKIKFYLDIYEDYGPDFLRVEDVITRLARLATAKKAIRSKNQTLADEQAALFPS